MCYTNCGHMWRGCLICTLTKALLIVGGVNWGLVGVGMLLEKAESWNVVNMFLGSTPTLEAVVYVLVGIAALASIFGCRCKKCMSGCSVCGAENKVGSN